MDFIDNEINWRMQYEANEPKALNLNTLGNIWRQYCLVMNLLLLKWWIAEFHYLLDQNPKQ